MQNDGLVIHDDFIYKQFAWFPSWHWGTSMIILVLVK